MEEGGRREEPADVPQIYQACSTYSEPSILPSDGSKFFGLIVLCTSHRLQCEEERAEDSALKKQYHERRPLTDQCVNL